MERRNHVEEDDCLEHLPELPENSLDAIVTDPPYFIGMRNSNDDDGRKSVVQSTVLKPLFDTLGEQFERILKPDGVAFIFTDWRTYPTIYNALGRHVKIENCIVWDFDWIKAGAHFRYTHEFIVYAAMPDADSPKDRSVSDVWRFDTVNYTQERRHPAEKPVDVIQHAIELTTDRGDLVLDPFLGSGTTAIAAKRAGRDYYGIEADREYAQVARERIDAAEKQKAVDEYATND